MKPDGSAKTPILEGSILEMRPSPDGKKILVSAGDTEEHYSTEEHYWGPVHMHLWLMDDKGIRRLTSGNVRDGAASWSFDGKKIAFVSLRNPTPQIYIMDSDGKDEKPFIDDAMFGNWSPDGKRFAFLRGRPGRFRTHMVFRW